MEYVILANGKKVEWDEFSKWSKIKQQHNLIPKNTRGVITPHGKFSSIAKASNFYGVKGGTIRDWIKNKKNGFAYVGSLGISTNSKNTYRASGANNKRSRAVITPFGRFDTVKDASAFLKIHSNTLRNRIRDCSSGEYRFESDRSPSNVQGHPRYCRVMTPNGVFLSISSAAKSYGYSVNKMKSLIYKNNQTEFYWVLGSKLG